MVLQMALNLFSEYTKWSVVYDLFSFFYSDEEGTLKFDLLVWVEVFEMSPSGE